MFVTIEMFAWNKLIITVVHLFSTSVNGFVDNHRCCWSMFQKHCVCLMQSLTRILKYSSARSSTLWIQHMWIWRCCNTWKTNKSVLTVRLQYSALQAYFSSFLLFTNTTNRYNVYEYVCSIRTGFLFIAHEHDWFSTHNKKKNASISNFWSNTFPTHSPTNGHSCVEAWRLSTRHRYSRIICNLWWYFYIHIYTDKHTINVRLLATLSSRLIISLCICLYKFSQTKKLKYVQHVRRVRTGPPADEPPPPHHRTCAHCAHTRIVRKQFNSF